jgi:thiol-disulfide isomerase/thioredoxin
MKRITLIALLCLTGMAQMAFARDGYRIQVKFTDIRDSVKDSVAYLVHYYGKPLPTIFKTDSAHIDKNGVATIQSKDSILGGIYMILLSDRSTHFEFLLNNGDDMSITAATKDLPSGVKFKNSPENDRFQQYVDYLKAFGDRQQAMQKEFKEAKTTEDTAAVRKKFKTASDELVAYRRDYVKKYPGTLLTTIFNALEMPQLPEGKHYFPGTNVEDTTFAYTYMKAHYWDGFDFHDDRLVNTPIYDGKIDEYMNRRIYQWPDSVEHESDMLLAKARGTKDMFHYTLWWLTRNAENSKIMGMDEVFVYLVENYYMKGDAVWLTNDELAKYTDRASKIAPNVIGNVAPEINLPSPVSKKNESMTALKAKYTLLVFWSPECGHCQIEIPKIDSAYRAGLKDKGLRIYAVATEGDEKKLTEFINKNKLTDWVHVYDPEHVGDWRAKYDVYSTPTIYLLDEKKIIRGKRLDHTNIGAVMEMTEKKGKTTKQ